MSLLTVLFVVFYDATQLPRRHVLGLRGNVSPLSWDQDHMLTFEGNDTWVARVNLTVHVGDVVSTKVIVNQQQWQIGANNVFVVPPSQDTVRIELFPWFYTGAGVVHDVPGVVSTILGNTRTVRVFVPASFEENKHKRDYPVLVMHDGQNLFRDATAFGGVAWKVQDTINGMVISGEMDEIVVVGVDNTPDRINEYTYSYDAGTMGGGKGDLYLDFLEKEVLPGISVMLENRVSTNRLKRGILGSSLGGLISCYAGWTRPSVWGIAGCMSSSFWWNNQDFNNTILALPKPNVPITFYLDSGNQGDGRDDVDETIAVRDNMASQGFVPQESLYYYLDNGGRHNEKYWGARFHVPMSDLFPAD